MAYTKALVFFALIGGSMALKCWHSAKVINDVAVAYNFRNPQVPLVEKECASGDKSCMFSMYQVGKDWYGMNSCSTTAKADWKTTKKGNGDYSVGYCDTDYCNSSGHMKPAVALLLTSMAVLFKNLY